MTSNSCFQSTLPKQGSKESSLCLSVQTFVSKYFHTNRYANCKVQRDFLVNSMQASDIVMRLMRSADLAWRGQSQNRPRLQIRNREHLWDPGLGHTGNGSAVCRAGMGGGVGLSARACSQGNHSYAHGVGGAEPACRGAPRSYLPHTAIYAQLGVS